MKCVCGYDSEKLGKDFTRIKIKGFVPENKEEGNFYIDMDKNSVYMTGYICPKCGTLKIDI